MIQSLSTDLTNHRFKYFTVLERVKGAWECQCDCGKVFYAPTSALTKNRYSSCGCMKGNKAIDLTGQVFGIVTVIARNGSKNNSAAWLCKCECGNTFTTKANDLKANKVQSCGCTRKMNFNGKTHGLSHTDTYTSWRGMMERCSNPNHRSAHNYSERGLDVCQRWYKFEYFLEDMGLRPEGKSIDRINNDKGYEPNNCRWATSKEQRANQR